MNPLSFATALQDPALTAAVLLAVSGLLFVWTGLCLVGAATFRFRT